MIVGELQELKKCLSDSEFDAVFSFIEKVKKDQFQLGVWIVLNDDLKVLVLNKSSYMEGVFESHSIYKDLHFVIEGADTIYFGRKLLASVKSAYAEDGDFTLFNSTKISEVKYFENSFVLIDTHELHSNNISSSSTLKLVFKINSK